MGKEIERKFLVIDESWRSMASRSVSIVQAYLSRRADAVVRLRIAGDRAFITIKGANRGIVRNEWEYPLPVTDARQMIEAGLPEGTVISKTRHYLLMPDSHLWEIDEFHGALSGLVVAEIELSDSAESFEKPPFIGREVSDDPRYYNSALAAASAPPQPTGF
ncbi:MAG: CYTH domain-containing protein [Muribaculaceae bacterium]|nr:CYTH domain-containing protein [Muribaculaceae bacterium]